MPFEFEPTPLPGAVLIQPRRYADDRGWFQETFKASDFQKAGLPTAFVQDNVSLSSRGTLRGLHFQTGVHAQGKLVQVLAGAVWDVAVDLRPESAHFGRWFGVELTSRQPRLFYIPPGFAHGFVALEDGTVFSYKCTEEYHQVSEGGIRWNDPQLGISWPVTDVRVSPKDGQLPLLTEVFR